MNYLLNFIRMGFLSLLFSIDEKKGDVPRDTGFPFLLFGRPKAKTRGEGRQEVGMIEVAEGTDWLA